MQTETSGQVGTLFLDDLPGITCSEERFKPTIMPFAATSAKVLKKIASMAGLLRAYLPKCNASCKQLSRGDRDMKAALQHALPLGIPSLRWSVKTVTVQLNAGCKRIARLCCPSFSTHERAV
eukprot:4691989-Amphidinium_carterae.1